jgi:hypothetical protein
MGVYISILVHSMRMLVVTGLLPLIPIHFSPPHPRPQECAVDYCSRGEHLLTPLLASCSGVLRSI